MSKITKSTFLDGVRELARRDTDFARLYEATGLPGLRSRRTGYATLLRIISGQQVSTAAARAINGRMDALANPMTPEIFAKLSDDDLRAVGFSRQKMSYGRAIAESVLAGEFSFRRVARMDDETAIAEMIKLRGIGRWSAEVYLLFALRRPDIWPVDDLGIVIGVQGLKGLDGRPGKDAMLEYGEAWRPLRSVAARMLWHYVDVKRRGIFA
ncbi:MAG: DNA-3-methyladenine glycosylase 2 family protein [Rhodospirillales bacterium]|jgi:DNA-3-methyladenine glycosylase II|nr:hypothetical protein [Rhodospirillaceae bacterium]MDP6428134.1 DNA-3-methyladenine glycosylase 2 family protein [Rhodospirillales bacterium]MDP6645166.1 DNA-3-methyladenine glycosylase 2 family protein [Rhodospirillales bacterium]MDP6841267.1 DNA-3-methyladenine glycosylase 2 family protein [Rhodospirillales bacterium]|tara:strand:+ start:783 stop:1415 length:633 start_codon:yes stop_codon:yes gene_type:complete